jgi:hypothetical protein
MDTLKFFSKALNFVNELNKVYSDKYPNIRLYYKLMKKTPIGNSKAIERHCNLFVKYLNDNEECIKNKSLKNSTTVDIKFDDKIFININECIQQAEKPTKEVIFKHLQLLLYITKPSDDLKAILTTTKTNSKDELPKVEESKFIDNFINKIEKQFNDKEFNDPLSAAMNMMQSGLFSEIVQDMSEGVKTGSLDPQKLLGSVQGMLGDLTGGSVDINNILSGTSQNLEIKGENGENVNVDMNQMFNMVGNMMGGLNQSSSSATNNPMSMVSSLLPMLGGFSSSSSTPSIDALEEEMKKASLDDISKSLD